MIVGRGLIAQSLKNINSEKYLFYANGISNSVLHQIPHKNFELNEIKEIANSNQQTVFVYFSTCQVNSAYNYDRPYVKHKILIEEYIKEHFDKYLIVRASNLVGRNPWNSHTLFNYLFHALTVKEQIIINPVLARNFLDAAHFSEMLKTYLDNHNSNETIEIVNPVSYPMEEVLDEFEKCFSKKFIVEKLNDLNDFALFELNTSLSCSLFAQAGIPTEKYILTLLNKYYT